MRRTLPRVWLACLLLLVLACLDVTSTAERDLMVILAPIEIRIGLDNTITSFFVSSSNPPSRARYGRSSQLCREAVRNPDVDILFTTHPIWADYVTDRIDVLARGNVSTDRLVVALRPGTASGAATDVALLVDRSLGTIAVPSTESDSAGMYAREALLRYGIWSQLRGSLIHLSDSDAVLQALATGDADAAIVFGSTAEGARLPVVAEFDPAYHAPIRFEVLLLSDRRQQARALYQFVTGDRAVADLSPR